MNKKLKKILIVVIAICLFIIPAYHPEADSGFDGSYSGGSWSDSGGSYYGGDYYGDYYGGIIITDDPVVALITLIIMLVVFGTALARAKKHGGNMPTTALKNVPKYDAKKFKELVPDFDEKVFKKQAFEIYQKVQTAWMEFDYDSLRTCVTDEMYNMYKSQLTTLSVKKQTNVMKDFKLLGFNIIGMETKDAVASLTVTMQVECFDYITDKDGKVVRGTNKRKVIYNYAMTFNKGLSTKDNKCPNCGAPLENVNSSECPYCNSTIISENYDWVLAKKQVLSQRYK